MERGSDTDGDVFYVVQWESSTEDDQFGNQCNRTPLSDVTVEPAEIVRGQAAFTELLRSFRADTQGFRRISLVHKASDGKRTGPARQ
eukprot:SAG11_NODE_1372_length_5095_cov_15.640312_6_plen_87_part_00